MADLHTRLFAIIPFNKKYHFYLSPISVVDKARSGLAIRLHAFVMRTGIVNYFPVIHLSILG